MICHSDVTETETVNITDYIITYQWKKGNISQTQFIGVNSSTLIFSPFKYSDLGLYTCQVTIMIESAYYNNRFDATDSFDIDTVLHSE